MRLYVRHRIRGLAAAMLLASVAIIAGTTAAYARPAAATTVTPFAGVFHPIKNLGNSKCLAPAQPVINASIVVVDCGIPAGDTPAKRWQTESQGGLDFRLINQDSGLCVYLNQFPIVNGSPLIQTDCTAVSNEVWTLSSTPPDVMTIRSKAGGRVSSFCVDAAPDRVTVQMFGCNGTLAQRWLVGFDLG